LADCFAEFFDNKIKKILSETFIGHEQYNGNRKLFSYEMFFMDKDSIRECIESLATKNLEGYDRIPQRVIKDGCEILIEPFTELFKRIYYKKTIPGQWLISKTVPVYKNEG
jgi:hypothetical protein